VQILVDNRELAPAGRPAAPVLPNELKLPPGELKLPPGVKLDEKSAAAKPASSEQAGRYVEIPPKYYQFETADLSYTVRPEPQTHDIELK
jgi:hypothetical protein